MLPGEQVAAQVNAEKTSAAGDEIARHLGFAFAEEFGGLCPSAAEDDLTERQALPRRPPPARGVQRLDGPSFRCDNPER